MEIYYDRTFVAQYEELYYTVYYDPLLLGTLNGPASEEVQDGSNPVYAADPTPNEGFTFLWWLETDIEGTIIGGPYTSGEINAMDITSDRYFQALYELTPYATLIVQFEPNGGTPDPDDQMVTEGDTATEPGTEPTKEGYTFTGWYTDESLTTLWNFDNPVTESMTLYAGWVADRDTPSDDGDDDSGIETISTDIPESDGNPKTGAEYEMFIGSMENPVDVVPYLAALILAALIMVPFAIRKFRKS
jgi:uncharacterized repeat protein (TIGR02543 family)